MWSKTGLVGGAGVSRAIDGDKLFEYIQKEKAWKQFTMQRPRYDKGKQDAYYEMLEIIQEQPTIQPESWIPVSEKLPECEEEVLIFTERNKITTAIYEDGKMPEDESMWNWYEVDFDYDEENDINYVPEGWWEYRHFNPDDVYNNAVDEKVIAWMPLPESFKGGENE